MAMRNVSGGKGSPGMAGGTYTRPVAKVAAKVVAKVKAKQAKKEVANTKKAVRYVVEKVQPKTIAENSVKVRRGNPSEAKRMNEFSDKRTQDIASGKRAKSEEASVKNMKPAKVVKINSSATKAINKKLPNKNY